MRARTLGLVSAAVLTPVAAVLTGYTVWIVGQWLDEKAANAMIYPEPKDNDVPSVDWPSLAWTVLYGDGYEPDQ